MSFDATCVRCGATLVHDPHATTCSEYGTIHHSYQCPAETCPATGGTVITCDGEVTRRIGAAVDPAYSQPRSLEVSTGDDRHEVSFP